MPITTVAILLLHIFEMFSNLTHLKILHLKSVSTFYWLFVAVPKTPACGRRATASSVGKICPVRSVESGYLSLRNAGCPGDRDRVTHFGNSEALQYLNATTAVYFGMSIFMSAKLH
jgi:hypothetical protein